MSQDWNATGLPWQTWDGTNHVWKNPSLSWNSTALPWKNGSGIVFSGSASIPVTTAASSSLGTFSVTGGTGSYVYTFGVGSEQGTIYDLVADELILLDTPVAASYALIIKADNSVDPVLTLNLTLTTDFVPTVSSVAVTSSAGADSTYVASDVIQVTVTFSEAVTVTGTPQITVAIGGNIRAFNYASGTGTAALVFSYTVQTGDVDTDGIAISANQLALNSGTIKDSALQAATLTHSSVAAQSAHKVDAVAPTISSMSLTSSAGGDNTYKAGDVVQATVIFSEAVTITGTPQLTLTIGSGTGVANYASGTGTTSIVFSYTVQAGDTDTNGISIGANAVALNSGTIKDAVLNSATITHSSVADNASHKVDTTAPSLSLPTDTATGGTTADIGATTDEANGTLFVAVTPTSTPPSAAQIIAGTGGGIVVASSVSVSSTGAKTVGVTGLSVSTSYFGHAVHRDATGNISSVVTGNGFTTTAGAETWDSGKKNADITLSGSDLIATRGTSGGQAVVLSVNGHSTGKYHVRFKITTVGSFYQLGFASGGLSLSGYIGLSTTGAAHGVGHFPYFNGSFGNGESTTFDTQVNNECAVEIDLDNLLFRFQNITRISGWCTDVSIAGLTGLPWFIAFESDDNTVIQLMTSDLTAATSGFGTW